MNKNSEGLTAEEIVNRIRKRARQDSLNVEGQEAAVNYNNSSIKVDWGSIERDLDRASAHSMIANLAPPMSHHPPIVRVVAQASARTVTYLSKFITASQTFFNIAVLKALRGIGNLFLEIENDLKTLSQQIGEEETRTTAMIAELPVITSKVDEVVDAVAESQESVSQLIRLHLDKQKTAIKAARNRVKKVDGRVDRLQQDYNSLSELEHVVFQQDEKIEKTKLDIEAINQQIKESQETLLQFKAAKLLMSEQNVRLQGLELGLEDSKILYRETLSELDQLLGEKASRDEGREMLVQFYPALEDRLRGPRREIKERQSIYLSTLRDGHISSLEAPILDLGCGRGEWLELLEEADFDGIGVDINPGMVKRCSDRGLNAIQSDTISYLRGAKTNSLAAITCFHLLEHLQPELILSLLMACYRCLKKGGLLILETPNPESPYVGTCGFHLDPTHVRPLPHQLLSFFVEEVGFETVEILRLHPSSGEGETDAAALNLDYALLALKGHHISDSGKD